MIYKWILFLFLFDLRVSADKTESQVEFETGNESFVKRKYSDALLHYHKAIEIDPLNYQAIYRRATTYLVLGRTKPAIADFDTVLEQKPDFGGARQQRANVLMKMGDLEAAKSDFRYLINTTPSNEEIQEKLKLIQIQSEDRENLERLFAHGECESVEALATKMLESQPWDASLYVLRAKCYEQQNRLKLAIHDLKHASKLSSDNTDLLYDLSTLEYKVAEIHNSLSTIRDCLKLNPDHKRCYSSYKTSKKIVKLLDSMKNLVEQKDWKKCLEAGEKLLKSNENDVSIKVNVYRLSCQCNREEGNLGAAIQECNEILEFDDSDVDTLLQRAEAYMLDEEYDLATADFDKALEWDPSNEAAQSGKEQAKRAKELVGKRDYYKILGVRRNANKREITKAYRKMAQKWHPDNFQDEKDKKKAEKKFIDIAAAKEVLSDEEKRRAFDNGQDPLDSEKGHRSQNSGGFNGFQGFNPFGGRGGRGDFFFHF
ncbi:unnamed protein product [Caenorhabditis brenneri]